MIIVSTALESKRLRISNFQTIQRMDYRQKKGIQKTHITDYMQSPAYLRLFEWPIRRQHKMERSENCCPEKWNHSKILSQFMIEATTTQPKIDSNDFR